MNMKALKKNRGVTLIALVITIIVLLILAGVSISMLTGDNGILTQATKAKDETIKAGEIEAINLAMANVKMKKSLEGYEEIITASELQEQLHKDGKETATVEGEKILTVTFSDTHNTYRVTQEGEINYKI